MRKILIAISIAAINTATNAASYALTVDQETALQNIVYGEVLQFLMNGKTVMIEPPEFTRFNDMYSLYYSNEIAVQKKYVGKPVRYMFNVGRVALENNAPVVYINGASPKGRLNFIEKSEDDLVELKRSSELLATCTLKSITKTDLEFVNCSVDKTYIQNYVQKHKNTILGYFAGQKIPNVRAYNHLITTLAIIKSLPPHSECFRKPDIMNMCGVIALRDGQPKFKLEAYKEAEKELKVLGYEQQ